MEVTTYQTVWYLHCYFLVCRYTHGSNYVPDGALGAFLFLGATLFCFRSLYEMIKCILSMYYDSVIFIFNAYYSPEISHVKYTSNSGDARWSLSIVSLLSRHLMATLKNFSLNIMILSVWKSCYCFVLVNQLIVI